MEPFLAWAGEVARSAISLLSTPEVQIYAAAGILAASAYYLIKSSNPLQKIDVSKVPIVSDIARRLQKTPTGRFISSFVLGMEVDDSGSVSTTPLDMIALIPIGRWLKAKEAVKMGTKIFRFPDDLQDLSKIEKFFMPANVALKSVTRADSKTFILKRGYAAVDDAAGRGRTHILERHFYRNIKDTTNFKQLGLKTEQEVEDLVMKAAKEGKFVGSEKNTNGLISDIYVSSFNKEYDIKVIVSHDTGEIITAHPLKR